MVTVGMLHEDFAHCMDADNVKRKDGMVEVYKGKVLVGMFNEELVTHVSVLTGQDRPMWNGVAPL